MLTDVILSCVIGVFAVVQVTEGAFIPNGGDSSAPVFLGQVGGKNYSHVHGNPMSWEQAGEFCREHGLQLGTIKVRNESDFLIDAVAGQHLNGSLEFWTGARDSRYFQEAFRWNTTIRNNELYDVFDSWTFAPIRFVGVPYGVCATFRVNYDDQFNRNYLNMRSAPCAELVQGAICETTEAEQGDLEMGETQTQHRDNINGLSEAKLSEKAGTHIQRKRVGGVLTHMGSVEGKDFYEVDGVPMNWVEAETYCKSHNLSLGRIETFVQKDFLISAYLDLNLEPWIDFWTAAREARYFNVAFRWNDTGARVTQMYDSWTMSNSRFEGVPFETCATFQITPGETFAMISTPCREVIEGTLCESLAEEESVPDTNDINMVNLNF